MVFKKVIHFHHFNSPQKYCSNPSLFILDRWEGCAFAWPSNVDGDELRCVSHGDIVGGIGAWFGAQCGVFLQLEGWYVEVVGTDAKVEFME